MSNSQSSSLSIAWMGSGALHAADVNLDSFALKDAAVSVSFQIIPRVVGQRWGNKYKLLNHTFHYNFRKFSFAARIVNIWNSLPDYYVVDVNSVAVFKQEAQLVLG